MRILLLYPFKRVFTLEAGLMYGSGGSWGAWEGGCVVAVQTTKSYQMNTIAVENK